MERKNKIVALMERLNLSNEDLEIHKKAYFSLSHYGNHKPLDAIPEEQRNKFAEFYSTIRKHGIYEYNYENGSCKVVKSYEECWVDALRNNPNMPGMDRVTVDEVKEMLRKSAEEVKKQMRHREIKEEYSPEIPTINEVLKTTKNMSANYVGN